MKLKIILALLLLLSCFTIAFIYLRHQNTGYISVNIVNTGAICYETNPPQCPDYDVIVRLEDGSERTYIVEGTNDSDNKKYDDISMKINRVVYTNNKIKIKVVNNEIISVKY